MPLKERKFSLVAVVAAFLVLEATAAEDAAVGIDIEQQPLPGALLEFSEQTGLQLAYVASLANGKISPGTQGRTAPEAALSDILDGTALEYQFVNEDTVAIGAGRTRRQGESKRKGNRSAPAPILLVQPEQRAGQSEADDGEDSPEEDQAGEQDNEGDPLELGVQTVTGSRLSRTSEQISNQVIVLSNEDLRNSGAPTLEQALRQLPQNINGTTEFGGAGLYATSFSERLLGTANINGSSTINLRGLGESATLVLIDGKRAGDSGLLGGFTDISEIPVSIVERVEIQLDGASAIYGSDAIGGVVNIILKKEYDLVRVTLRRTARTRGGLTEDNAAVTAGAAWGTGDVMFSGDVYKASDQDIGMTDLLGLGIQLYGYPGNVRGGPRGSPTYPREISPSLTRAARDAGVIGPDETVTRVLVPTGQDGVNLTAGDFLDSANTFRVDDGLGGGDISITPGSDRHTFRVAANQRLGDWLDMSAGISYAGRKTSSNGGPAGGNVTLNVAAENPYNPFGRDVNVDLSLLDFGTRRGTGNRESWTLDLDFSGTVGGKWDWDLRSRWASRKSAAKTTNYVNVAALNELVDETRTDPSSALNVFGNSFLTDASNASVLGGADFYHPFQRSDTSNELASSELVVRRDLLSLPAGEIRAVFGAEWRRSSVDVDYGNTYSRIIRISSPVGLAPVTSGFAEKGTRTLRAGFAEFFVPIVSKSNASPGVRDLNLTLSGRHESADGSSSSGTESNSRYQSNVWSVGLAYRPIEAVKLRVNRSTSYRAPDVAYALLSPVASPGFILDFRIGGFGFTSITNIAGGTPDLKPEESTSITAGMELSLLNGLTVSVDYHDTLFENRIAALNTLGGLFLLDAGFDTFHFQYTLDEDGRVTTFDSRPINIAYVDTRGLDYRLDYRFEISGNSFGLSANVAVTREHFEDINTYDAQPAEDLVGARIPEYRYRASLFWERPGWRLALSARTSSGVRYSYVDGIAPPPDPDIQRIHVKTDPATVVDFRGTLSISEIWSAAPAPMQDLQLAFGLNNIFKSFTKTELDPRPFDGHLGIPRNTNSARGQTYYLEISKEF